MPEQPSLILPRITKHTHNSGDGEWIPWKWHRTIFAYMASNDAWCDEKHSKLEYNRFYHFYDFRLFPCENNKGDFSDPVAWGKAALSAWERGGMKAKIADKSYFRWKNGEKLGGVRIWIEV